MFFVASSLQEPNMQQWPLRQIKVRLGIAVDPLLHGCGLFSAGKLAEIVEFEPDRLLLGDDLERRGGFHCKGGAQNFVTGNDRVERLLQRVQLQFASQSKGRRQIVGGIGSLKLCQKPKPLLGKGERDRSVRCAGWMDCWLRLAISSALRILLAKSVRISPFCWRSCSCRSVRQHTVGCTQAQAIFFDPEFDIQFGKRCSIVRGLVS